MVEQIEDEVPDNPTTRIKDVRCCRVGFAEGKAMYSEIIPCLRGDKYWWLCSRCGASYGEVIC
jgi:hypothetical protein